MSPSSSATGGTYQGTDLPFQGFDLAKDSRTITLTIDRRRWSCNINTYACAPVDSTRPTGTPMDPPRPSSVSPDGLKAAFIRDHNLWVKDLLTGRETALTTDGVKDFGYATNNAGWVHSDRPVVTWSPDSKKIATFQHDGRQVGEMYLVDTRVGHPRLEAWKYPLPGDEHIFMLHRVIIDVEQPKVVRLKTDPDPHRSSLCDHVVCRGEWVDVQWGPDSEQLAFVSTSRDPAGRPRWALLALAGLPLALVPIRTVLHAHDPPALVGALVATARLEVAVAALLGVGLVVS